MTTLPAVTVTVAVAVPVTVSLSVAVTVSRTVSFSVTVKRWVTVAGLPAPTLAVLVTSTAPFARPGDVVAVATAVAVVVVVVLSSIGTTTSLGRVEVAMVVGPWTVVKAKEAGTVNAGSCCEERGGVTVDSGVGSATSGSMVRVMVAVPVGTAMVAVRVMGLVGRLEEVVCEVLVELIVARVAELVVVLAEEVVAGCTREEEGEEDDVVAGVGSTVTVTVPKPEVVTMTTVVLVVGPALD
jgi:hypothetical protein